MKIRLLFFVITGLFLLSGCSNSEPVKKDNEMNPFLSNYTTPFEVPPFNLIKTEHFMPAFIEGIKKQTEVIDGIVNSSVVPDFENTIAALDYSSDLLTKVSSVFFNLTSSDTNDSLKAIAREVSPLLSKHRDDISLNAGLFAKVKAVYETKDELNLNTEQAKLLEDTYKSFARGGANLTGEAQERFREINKEISLLTLKFGENVLEETNKFQLVIDNEADLAGLPESAIEGAKADAKAAGMEGKWLFSVQKPSMIPFLTYSEKRDLREKIFKGYINRGDNNNKFDNKSVLTQIALLRLERANILGYKNHADFVLEETMAKEPEIVYSFLDKLWTKALPMAKAEAKELQTMIDNEGGKFKLEAWDWWYYSERLRKQKYDLDEEALRPYFKLENVVNGAFDVANKLYGLQFIERTDIPVYNTDAHAYEVLDIDSSHLAVLYMDFFPRESKSGGAWMSDFRGQMKVNGENISPVITVVCNFSKPSGDKPSLLTFEEVSTLFHEFGHALHGMLSDCTYPGVSGTNVVRDFVELPSQVMENWCAEPEVLNSFAKHYLTGENIPSELLDKLENSKYFNQGFVAVEYLSACYLDLDWHTISEKLEVESNAFETASMNKIGLIPEIVVRYRSPYFSHIFSGGYSSGYYSYIWAELLDADAFEAFKETSLFDPETALAFRKNILEKGGSDDAMTLYRKFRGADPSIEPLLKRKGFSKN